MPRADCGALLLALSLSGPSAFAGSFFHPPKVHRRPARHVPSSTRTNGPAIRPASRTTQRLRTAQATSDTTSAADPSMAVAPDAARKGPGAGTTRGSTCPDESGSPGATAVARKEAPAPTRPTAPTSGIDHPSSNRLQGTSHDRGSFSAPKGEPFLSRETRPSVFFFLFLTFSPGTTALPPLLKFELCKIK